MKSGKFLFYTLIGVILGSMATFSKQQESRSEKHQPHLFEQSVDKILVLKSQRQLFLLHQNEPIKAYTIDLGAQPIGHKQQQGDNKTPEGLYYISGRNPKSKYFLSLRISYPDKADIKRSQAQHVDPGGDIMIHGLPNAMSDMDSYISMPKDWTAGCIAVQTNAEMQEIWDNVPIGTPIEIRP